jgi:tRNA-specific 2-thiouridylase
MTFSYIPEKSSVVVGMSGGVDSSVSAAILKEMGYSVIGLFMDNWEEKNPDGACTAQEDFEDVRRVCTILGIPYYTVNYAEEYRKQVFDNFLSELKKGRTPNPDILCNREIKFKKLLEEAEKLGAVALATGHYAQNIIMDGHHKLVKASDTTKDQTYFLYTLNESILKKVLFPVGGMTKKEVRALAEKWKLPNAKKKDSTGICFIGERNFRQFLSQFLPFQRGNFETLEGKIVGTHCGIAYYTIGQRRGLGLGGEGAPWFVVAKDVERNVVVVERGENHPALFADSLTTLVPTWVSGVSPTLPFSARAKIRYRQPEQECTIEKSLGDTLSITFANPQRAITPEQSIVFYSGECCIGGAIIAERGKSYYEQKKLAPETFCC